MYGEKNSCKACASDRKNQVLPRAKKTWRRCHCLNVGARAFSPPPPPPPPPQGLRLLAVPAHCGTRLDFLVASLVGLPSNHRRIMGIRGIHLGMCTALQTCTALQHPANCWDWVMNMWKRSVFPHTTHPLRSLTPKVSNIITVFITCWTRRIVDTIPRCSIVLSPTPGQIIHHPSITQNKGC